MIIFICSTQSFQASLETVSKIFWPSLVIEWGFVQTWHLALELHAEYFASCSIAFRFRRDATSSATHISFPIYSSNTQMSGRFRYSSAIVETVTDHKLVRNLKTHVFQLYRPHSPVRLIE